MFQRMPPMKKMVSEKVRILGIDPGYERVGIAIIEKTNKGDELVYSECFKTAKEEDFPTRLELICKKLVEIIKKYKPKHLSIENLFLEKNQKTAMRVSEVRGAIIYESKKQGLSISEYTPLQVKIATTGYGKSDKRQVAFMVSRIIRVNKKIVGDDEMDAIAVGITGSSSFKNQIIHRKN